VKEIIYEIGLIFDNSDYYIVRDSNKFFYIFYKDNKNFPVFISNDEEKTKDILNKIKDLSPIETFFKYNNLCN